MNNLPPHGSARDRLLAGYLQDHLLAATSGVRLFDQATHVWKGTPHEATLARLTAEIRADKAELEALMTRLGFGMPAHKTALAWMGAQVSKLDPINPFRTAGGVSGQLELEALLTAVKGKSLLWETLLLLEPADPRIGAAGITRLKERAHSQMERIDGILRATVPARFQAPD